jgi:hypothetical protein
MPGTTLGRSDSTIVEPPPRYSISTTGHRSLTLLVIISCTLLIHPTKMKVDYLTKLMARTYDDNPDSELDGAEQM